MKNIKRGLTFFLVLATVGVPLISHAAVSQLVFTTDPRTVTPGAISEVITIQTQNESGTEFKMEETGDVGFVSSSATGQFVNAAGEPVSTVMNRNSANRNFYYRDETMGSPTLTVTVTGRTSGTVWSASQAIIVGAGASNSDGGDDGADDSTATTTPPAAPPPAPTASGPLSAHESPVPVSSVAPSEPFRVGAGRPRLASVHGPVVFRAESAGVVPAAVRYQWSFGDGGSAAGEQVNHVYYFPGEYNVVLNAVDSDGKSAVSRTTVSIIQPAVALGLVSSDRVEIINRSARELNLGGWRIVQDPSAFTFPPDTIIAVGKSTVVPSATLGFSIAPSASLALIFPDATPALVSVPAPGKETLEALARSLRQLSAKLAAVKTSRLQNIQTVQATPAVAVTIPSTSSPQFAPSEAGLTAVAPPPPVATVATIPVPKSPGFFARIKHWFGK